MSKRNLWVIILIIVFLVLVAGCTGQPVKPAADPNQSGKSEPRIKITMNDPNVDLATGVIRAAGTGKPPAQSTSEAQSKLMARRAAIVDATRNLAQKLAELDKLVLVPNEQTDGQATLVKNQKILKEEQLQDGTYTVLMEMPLEQGLLKRLREATQ